MAAPVHPDAETLALLALGESAEPQQMEHVRACSLCSAELAELRTVVTTARSLGPEDVPVTPPASVWDGVTAELGLAGGPPERKATVPPPASRWRWALPIGLAACAAGLVVGLLVGRAIAPGEDAGPVVASAELDPLAGSSAAGTVQIVGTGDSRSARISVSGLPQRDGFYEAWLLDLATSRLVSLGAVPTNGSSVVLPLPAGLILADYPAVDVSLEPLDGDPSHSAVSVARGTLRG